MRMNPEKVVLLVIWESSRVSSKSAGGIESVSSVSFDRSNGTGRSLSGTAVANLADLTEGRSRVNWKVSYREGK
jgi:hypothetical protein